jgi:hypothetical protein
MSDSDDDYDYEEDRGLPVNSKRYPLHDCVEFEDVQALKVRSRRKRLEADGGSPPERGVRFISLSLASKSWPTSVSPHFSCVSHFWIFFFQTTRI